MHVFGIIFLVILILCLIAIVAMLFSLAKQGDERRKIIVGKSCANTFLVMVAYLLISVIETMISHSGGINPITMLSVLSIIYLIELLYHKKKYGD